MEARAVSVMQQLSIQLLWDTTEALTQAATDLMRAIVLVEQQRAVMVQDDARTALADAIVRMRSASTTWNDTVGHVADAVAESLGF